jgi:hypothetical protein
MTKQIVSATEGWRALVLMVEVLGGEDMLIGDYDPETDARPITVTAVQYPIAAWSVDDVANEALPIAAVAGITADGILSPEGGCVRYTTAGDPTAGTPYRSLSELTDAALAEVLADWQAEQA